MADKQLEITIKTNADTSQAEKLSHVLEDIVVRANDAGSSASNALDDIGAAADGSSESLSEAGKSAEDMGASVENIDSTPVNDLDEGSSNADESMKNAAGSADEVGKNVGNIPTEPMDDLTNKSNEAADAMANAAESADLLSGFASGVAAAGIGAAMYEAASEAGSYGDSMVRLGYAMSGTAMTAEQAEKTYGASIKAMSGATGRSASSIRSYFAQMAVAGVKNQSLLEKSFEGVAAAAFITNKSVDQVGASFQRITLSGMASKRSLVQLGISIEDLASAMGVSVDEASKKFKELDQEARAAALSQAMSMKYGTEANEAFKNSWEGVLTQFEKAKDYLIRIAGGLILPVLVPALELASSALNTLAGMIDKLPAPLKTALSGLVVFGGGVVTAGLALNALRKTASMTLGPFKDLYKYFRGGQVSQFRKDIIALKEGYASLKKAITGATAAQEGFNKANALSGVSGGAGKSTGPIVNADKMTRLPGSVDKVGDGVKGVGPKAGAASAEARAASTGLHGLGSSLRSLIVPILEIAAVIAVIIAVVAVLAAEALIFARALGELIKKLDFKSLDLKPQIEGIKQIGSALWELTRAFAAMTLLAGVTAIYNAVRVLTLFTNPVELAVNQLKKIGPMIQELGAAANIDDSVPEKIRNLTESLKAISVAMSALAVVTYTMYSGNLITLNGFLGSFVTNLQAAKDDLTSAASIINGMTSVADIDEAAVEKLRKLSESLKSVNEAISAMGSITWDLNIGNLMNLGGLLGNFVSALETARADIIRAAPILNSFSGITDIDDSVSEKLRKVADTIKPVNETMTALNGISWEQSWSNLFGGFITTLQDARRDIGEASVILASFSTIADIPEGIGDKIQRVSWTATNVLNAIKTLKPFEGLDVNFEAVNMNISNAVTSLRGIVNELNTLSGASVDDVAGLISSVQNVLTQLTNALNTARVNVRGSAVGIGLSIKEGVRTGLAGLASITNQAFTQALNAVKGVAHGKGTEIGSAVSTSYKTALHKIVGATQQEVSSALNALKARQSEFRSAGAALGRAAAEGYRSTGLEQHSPGLIAQATKKEVSYAVSALKNGVSEMYSSGTELADSLVRGYGDPSLSAPRMEQLKNMIDDESFIDSLGNNKLLNNEGLVGDTYNVTNEINIGSVDSKDRVDEIVEAVRKSLSWSNVTAGRTV